MPSLPPSFFGGRMIASLIRPLALLERRMRQRRARLGLRGLHLELLALPREALGSTPTAIADMSAMEIFPTRRRRRQGRRAIVEYLKTQS
jgi:hypothetical protein